MIAADNGVSMDKPKPRAKPKLRMAYQPICPEHLLPLEVRSTPGVVAYCYCPVEGCKVSKSVPREEVPQRVVGE